ncbi:MULTISPECIES: MFS transporter [unclassified Rathayibacter]|uniref:MFS transporter n=1 Tax=unclassified Rathayibacter TaxID=2609250 RepID=UPI0010512502|nr:MULTISPECIES: MFS transporter [unclassified Rathayibacter]TCL83089.1 EmrB/QacA subfamily drug resistance transporter [Rathayibacter sp. PhB192]TCM28587.1 EmrB/QacA subfamily drug resistance transporter [Rathayibacter sp. PhB179]
MTATAAEPLASRRKLRPNLVIAVLAFAGMGASFMQTILIPIQAQLPELLDASRDDTAWVITVTLLVSAICTPVSGKLGDMYGKRRVAIVLLSLLIAGSVICALSPTVVPLIIGRGLQGTGMGVIPLGISILRDILPKERLGSAIALVSATLGVGGALGLPISALVTENFDWHALFWVAAAIGAVALALFVLVIPAGDSNARGRFDFGGAVGLAIGLVGLLLAVSRGNEWGWTSAPTLISAGIGVVALLLWGWYELRRSNPLVDLRVSARGPVLMTNLASVAMGFALFSSSIVFPQLLQLPETTGGLGLPLLEASLILMPSGLAMLAMSPVAGRVEKRVGPKPLLVAGAVIIALAYLAAVVLEPTVWLVLVINVVIGIGIGLGYAAMPTLIMRAVPVSESGAANGLNTLMRALGTSIAAAVVAAVLANSAVSGSGGSVPSESGFTLALLFGLAAAILCAALAVFIPKPRILAEEEPALPGEVLPALEPAHR